MIQGSVGTYSLTTNDISLIVFMLRNTENQLKVMPTSEHKDRIEYLVKNLKGSLNLEL